MTEEQFLRRSQNREGSTQKVHSASNYGTQPVRRNMTLQPIEESVHRPSNQAKIAYDQQQVAQEYIGLAPLQQRSGKNLKVVPKNQILYVPQQMM